MTDRVSLPTLTNGKFTGRALNHITFLTQQATSTLKAETAEALATKADQATLDNFIGTLTSTITDSEAKTALAATQAALSAERASREESSSALERRVQNLEDAEPDLSAYATVEQVEALDPLPKGGTNGQILARAGRDSAEWVPAPGTSIRSVTATSDNKMRVTLSDGSVSDIPVKLESTWSKDAQAKVQGYWEIVSEEEPEQKTYTTRDGVTVPVKWTKPFTQIVPIFPETPEWDDYEQKILVPALVGVTYQYVSGGTIPPGEWVSVPGEPPFDVTVEAVAAPGYQLIASPKWVHSFPDPRQVTVLTSDSFDRPDAGWDAIGQSDAADGGQPMAWTSIGDVRNVSPESAQKLVRIESNQLKIGPYSLADQPAGVAWAGIRLDGISENWRLEFNLADYQNAKHGATLNLIIGPYGPNNSNIDVEFYRLSGSRPDYDINVRWRDEETKAGRTSKILSGVTVGRYSIEKFRNTFSVHSPQGARSISLVNHTPASHAVPYLYFRIPRGGVDTVFAVIDDFKLTKLGF